MTKMQQTSPPKRHAFWFTTVFLGVVCLGHLALVPLTGWNDSGHVTNKNKTLEAAHEVEEERKATKKAPFFRPFPRWDEATGIELAPILEAARAPIFLEKWSHESAYCHGEFLYTFSPRDGTKKSNNYDPRNYSCWEEWDCDHWLVARIEQHDRMMKHVWLAYSHSLSGEESWPHLSKLQKINTSLPFLVAFYDNSFCNERNWRNKSVPIFSEGAPVDCNFSFPMPSFNVPALSLPTASHWLDRFEEARVQYPWHNKTRQAAWRGTLLWHSRWTLAKTAFEANQEAIAKGESKMFDVGLSGTSQNQAFKKYNLSEVGGKRSKLHPITAFQRYRAVLDVDGTAWSGRFASLLCLNSVVLKQDPEFTEYYHFQADDPLLPWTHYIPLQRDLSDLVEQTRFALDPANDKAVHQIMTNANAWCRRNMVLAAYTHNMLDILEEYARLLFRGDANWATEWNRVSQKKDFQDTFKMRMLD